MLFVDDDEREIAEFDTGLEERVRAGENMDRPGGEIGQGRFALCSPLAAGQDGHPKTGGLRQRRQGSRMLARQQFRRRHDGRLAAGFDHRRRGQQRDHGLSRSDISLKQPQHPFRLPEVGLDFGDRPPLPIGQLERQRGSDLRLERTSGDPRPASAALLMVAHQSDRDLAGEQLIMGET